MMDNLIHWKPFIAKIFLLRKIIFKCSSQFRSIFYKTMEREWEQNPLLLFSVEDFFEDDGETEDTGW